MTTRSIQERRVALGLSRRDLAAQAGVDRGLLARVEDGRHTARPETVQRIHTALDRAEEHQHTPPAEPGAVTVEVLLPEGARLRFTGPAGAAAAEAAEFLRVHANHLKER